MGIIMCSISIKATQTCLATIFWDSRDGDHYWPDPARAFGTLHMENPSGCDLWVMLSEAGAGEAVVPSGLPFPGS